MGKNTAMLWQDGKKTDSWKINSGTIQNKQSSQDTFQPSTPSPHLPPSASLSLDFLPFKRQTCQQQQFTHKATSTASQYLGEEGQRKWSVGWREGEGGKGHTHSSAGFEAETNLRGGKKKVNSKNGSREGEQVRGGLIRKKQKNSSPYAKMNVYAAKGRGRKLEIC